jgi:hypothetical protein
MEPLAPEVGASGLYMQATRGVLRSSMTEARSLEPEAVLVHITPA